MDWECRITARRLCSTGYSIVAGVPATVVAHRFTDKEIERHEELMGYADWGDHGSNQ